MSNLKTYWSEEIFGHRTRAREYHAPTDHLSPSPPTNGSIMESRIGKIFEESLDAREYHAPTDHLPPSPTTNGSVMESRIGKIFEESLDAREHHAPTDYLTPSTPTYRSVVESLRFGQRLSTRSSMESNFKTMSDKIFVESLDAREHYGPIDHLPPSPPTNGSVMESQIGKKFEESLNAHENHVPTDHLPPSLPTNGSVTESPNGKIFEESLVAREHHAPIDHLPLSPPTNGSVMESPIGKMFEESLDAREHHAPTDHLPLSPPTNGSVMESPIGKMFEESLDAREYHAPIDHLLPSPPINGSVMESQIGKIFEERQDAREHQLWSHTYRSVVESLIGQRLSTKSSMKTDLPKKTYARIKYYDLRDPKSKRQTNQSVTESGVKVLHILSQYAKTYELEKFKENKIMNDARVYHPPTNLIPPSPPTSSIIGSLIGQRLATATSMKTDLHKKTYASIKSYDSKDSESKEQTKKSVTESDVKVSHVLSQYATTYELEKFKENKMIIFNHSEFLDGRKRPGTMKDEEVLRHTFAKFRFDVHTHHNLRMSKLMMTIKNFAQSNCSKYGCLCVAILTHGHSNPGYLHAFDKRFRENYIFDAFDASKNRTLVAKPIIFLIQACRGSQPSPNVIAGEKTPAPQLDNDEELEKYHLPTECDRIVFHSSYVGKASVRHPKDGSWFIQKLCDKVQEFGLTHDMETIFRMVRRVVALDCVTDEDWKQMPVVTSTTLRELRLAATVQKNSLQGRAGSSARPCSPAVSRCQINNPDVLLSDQLEELQLPLGESTENSVAECSPVQMMFHLRPCCCFLDYFDYLKDCLDSFCSHNTGDMVARNLLAMVAKIDSGSEYNLQKFSFIQHMWEHLESNKHLFPPDGFKFLHRTIFVPLNKTDTSSSV